MGANTSPREVVNFSLDSFFFCTSSTHNTLFNTIQLSTPFSINSIIIFFLSSHQSTVNTKLLWRNTMHTKVGVLKVELRWMCICWDKIHSLYFFLIKIMIIKNKSFVSLMQVSVFSLLLFFLSLQVAYKTPFSWHWLEKKGLILCNLFNFVNLSAFISHFCHRTSKKNHPNANGCEF